MGRGGQDGPRTGGTPPAVKPAWVPGGTEAWRLLRISGDRPSQKEILGAVTGERSSHASSGRLPSLEATTVSNSEGLSLTFPQRHSAHGPRRESRPFEIPRWENKGLDRLLEMEGPETWEWTDMLSSF